MCRATLFLLIIIAVLQGCAAATVEQYSDFTPVFDPKAFFTGQLSAHGVVKNRGGAVIRTFNAEIQAHWQDNIGTLIEDFNFNDGESQRRIWTLTPDNHGAYIGTANDVIGSSEMRYAGNSVFMAYTLRINYDESTLDVHVDDRMYLVAPNVLINESRMTKYGVEVASIILTIIRQHDKDDEKN